MRSESNLWIPASNSNNAGLALGANNMPGFSYAGEWQDVGRHTNLQINFAASLTGTFSYILTAQGSNDPPPNGSSTSNRGVPITAVTSTSTNVGSGLLTDTTQTWAANQYQNYTLTDSAGNTFPIAFNTATTLSVSPSTNAGSNVTPVSTPIAGAYTIGANKWIPQPYSIFTLQQFINGSDLTTTVQQNGLTKLVAQLPTCRWARATLQYISSGSAATGTISVGGTYTATTGSGTLNTWTDTGASFVVGQVGETLVDGAGVGWVITAVPTGTTLTVVGTPSSGSGVVTTIEVGNTITIGGITLTATGSATPTTAQWQIAATANLNAAAIGAAIAANTGLAALVTESVATHVVTLTAVATGAQGNSITLAQASAGNFTLSAAHLTTGADSTGYIAGSFFSQGPQ